MYARGREAIVGFRRKHHRRAGAGAAAPEVFKKPSPFVNAFPNAGFRGKYRGNRPETVHETKIPFCGQMEGKA